MESIWGLHLQAPGIQVFSYAICVNISFPHRLFLLDKCSIAPAQFFYFNNRASLCNYEHLSQRKTLDSALLRANTWWGGENKRWDKRVGECEKKKKCRAPIWLCRVWGTIRQEVINTCHCSASFAARIRLFSNQLKDDTPPVERVLLKLNALRCADTFDKKKQRPRLALAVLARHGDGETWQHRMCCVTTRGRWIWLKIKK